MDPISFQLDPLTVLLLVVYLVNARQQRTQLHDLRQQITPDELLIRGMQRVFEQAAANASSTPQADP